PDARRFRRTPRRPRPGQNPRSFHRPQSPTAVLKKGAVVFLLLQATVRALDSGLINERPEAAIDATGLESQHTSSYFFKRAGKKQTARLWTKLTNVCDTGSHFITAAPDSTGPSNDSPQYRPSLNQAALVV